MLYTGAKGEGKKWSLCLGLAGEGKVLYARYRH